MPRKCDRSRLDSFLDADWCQSSVWVPWTGWGACWVLYSEAKSGCDRFNLVSNVEGYQAWYSAFITCPKIIRSPVLPELVRGFTLPSTLLALRLIFFHHTTFLSARHLVYWISSVLHITRDGHKFLDMQNLNLQLIKFISWNIILYQRCKHNN